MFRRNLRLLFFRSRGLRRLLAALGTWRMAREGMHVAHLGFYKEAGAFGPLQREEALLLNAVVRVARPKTIVEFGFSNGHSALNFIEAMDPDARLYSYDIAEDSRTIVGQAFSGEARFTYHHKSQTDYVAADIGGRQIDLCFIDAAHDFGLNQETWRRVVPSLAPGAIVAIHDTGVWHRRHFTSQNAAHATERPDSWLSDDVFQPHRAEREFVNWIREQDAGWSAIHFHTTATLRHGLTLLQRTGPLATDRTSPGVAQVA